MNDGALVLIIDDEMQIRRLLRIGLESSGYRVCEAATGQAGIQDAATLRPDLVILDLGLLDMDGLDVLRRLREWSRVPVIVLSVRDSDEDKIALFDAGADDYLTKPFSIGELLARLRVALRHNQPTDESPVFQHRAAHRRSVTPRRDGGRHAGEAVSHRVCIAADARRSTRAGC